ncbi:MAG: hypothetical protein LBT01_03155, partial [Spirochaetaceae bacterium]|nr:hypothetical protein [Spirochaetaceae bacterium]
ALLLTRGALRGDTPRRGGRAQRSAPVGGDFPLLYWITTIVPTDLPRIWKCTQRLWHRLT